jgi:hypothetical protein
MKTKIILLICAITLCFSACKKDKYQPKGDYATVSQVPTVKNYDFSITFGSSTTYGTYTLPSSLTSDDAVIVYWKEEGTGFLVQTPYIWYETSSSVGVNFWTEIGGITLFVNATRADGSSVSPWTTTSVESFRAIVINGSARKVHPEVNYSDYAQVKQAFHLRD